MLVWYLFGAGVAVLAGGRLLLLHPGEPVDLLEPLGHLEHLGEATSHAGHLGHPLAARVSRSLRDGECRTSFYATWQGVDEESPLSLFQHLGLFILSKALSTIES